MKNLEAEEYLNVNENDLMICKVLKIKPKQLQEISTVNLMILAAKLKAKLRLNIARSFIAFQSEQLKIKYGADNKVNSNSKDDLLESYDSKTSIALHPKFEFLSEIFDHIMPELKRRLKNGSDRKSWQVLCQATDDAEKILTELLNEIDVKDICLAGEESTNVNENDIVICKVLKITLKQLQEIPTEDLVILADKLKIKLGLNAIKRNCGGKDADDNKISNSDSFDPAHPNFDCLRQIFNEILPELQILLKDAVDDTVVETGDEVNRNSTSQRVGREGNCGQAEDAVRVCLEPEPRRRLPRLSPNAQNPRVSKKPNYNSNISSCNRNDTAPTCDSTKIGPARRPSSHTRNPKTSNYDSNICNCNTNFNNVRKSSRSTTKRDSSTCGTIRSAVSPKCKSAEMVPGTVPSSTKQVHAPHTQSPRVSNTSNYDSNICSCNADISNIRERLRRTAKADSSCEPKTRSAVQPTCENSKMGPRPRSNSRSPTNVPHTRNSKASNASNYDSKICSCNSDISNVKKKFKSTTKPESTCEPPKCKSVAMVPGTVSSSTTQVHVPHTQSSRVSSSCNADISNIRGRPRSTAKADSSCEPKTRSAVQPTCENSKMGPKPRSNSRSPTNVPHTRNSKASNASNYDSKICSCNGDISNVKKKIKSTTKPESTCEPPKCKSAEMVPGTVPSSTKQVHAPHTQSPRVSSTSNYDSNICSCNADVSNIRGRPRSTAKADSSCEPKTRSAVQPTCENSKMGPKPRSNSRSSTSVPHTRNPKASNTSNYDSNICSCNVDISNVKKKFSSTTKPESTCEPPKCKSAAMVPGTISSSTTQVHVPHTQSSRVSSSCNADISNIRGRPRSTAKADSSCEPKTRSAVQPTCENSKMGPRPRSNSRSPTNVPHTRNSKASNASNYDSKICSCNGDISNVKKKIKSTTKPESTCEPPKCKSAAMVPGTVSSSTTQVHAPHTQSSKVSSTSNYDSNACSCNADTSNIRERPRSTAKADSSCEPKTRSAVQPTCKSSEMGTRPRSNLRSPMNGPHTRNPKTSNESNYDSNICSCNAEINNVRKESRSTTKPDSTCGQPRLKSGEMVPGTVSSSTTQVHAPNTQGPPTCESIEMGSKPGPGTISSSTTQVHAPHTQSSRVSSSCNADISNIRERPRSTAKADSSCKPKTRSAVRATGENSKMGPRPRSNSRSPTNVPHTRNLKASNAFNYDSNICSCNGDISNVKKKIKSTTKPESTCEPPKCKSAEMFPGTVSSSTTQVHAPNTQSSIVSSTSNYDSNICSCNADTSDIRERPRGTAKADSSSEPKTRSAVQLTSKSSEMGTRQRSNLRSPMNGPHTRNPKTSNASNYDSNICSCNADINNVRKESRSTTKPDSTCGQPRLKSGEMVPGTVPSSTRRQVHAPNTQGPQTCESIEMGSKPVPDMRSSTHSPCTQYPKVSSTSYYDPILSSCNRNAVPPTCHSLQNALQQRTIFLTEFVALKKFLEELEGSFQCERTSLVSNVDDSSSSSNDSSSESCLQRDEENKISNIPNNAKASETHSQNALQHDTNLFDLVAFLTEFLEDFERNLQLERTSHVSNSDDLCFPNNDSYSESCLKCDEANHLRLQNVLQQNANLFGIIVSLTKFLENLDSSLQSEKTNHVPSSDELSSSNGDGSSEICLERDGANQIPNLANNDSSS